MPGDFLTSEVPRVGEAMGKGECPHSLCQLNGKEMKASVLMTEFGSEEAMGRMQGQAYDRVLKTQ